MIRELFTLHSQKLDHYLDYVASTPFADGATREQIIKMAKEFLVSDLLKAVSTKIIREHTATLIYKNSNIDLEWVDVEQGGRIHFWLNAVVTVEDGNPDASKNKLVLAP